MKDMAITSTVITSTSLSKGDLENTPLVNLRNSVVTKVITAIKQIHEVLVQDYSGQSTVNAGISYNIPSFTNSKVCGLSDVNLAYQIWFYDRKSN